MIRIKNNIVALDRVFARENIMEAVEYYKKNFEHLNKYNIGIVSTISIKLNDGNFDEIWTWRNPITVNNDGTYGIIESRIELDHSYVQFRGSMQDRLQVIFKLSLPLLTA